MNFIKSLQAAINEQLENNAKNKIRGLLDRTNHESFYSKDLGRFVEIQKDITIVGIKKISADVAMLSIFILLVLQ